MLTSLRNQGDHMTQLLKIIAAGIAALSVAGCVGERGTPLVLSADQRNLVQKEVQASLKDPESARFGDTIAAAQMPDGTIRACGTINAKTAMAGMLGPVPILPH